MSDSKKIIGIIRVNRYFIIILAISIIMGYAREISLLFLFVTLHELAHVLLAHIFKLKIKSIEIFPFGGVAKIDNLDTIPPSSEMTISIAGPLFNIIAAIFLFLLYNSGVAVPYYKYLVDINIGLALFNLLPGLPLDGGRIVRAMLSYFTGYKKATKAAVVLGKVVSIVLLASGIVFFIMGKVNMAFLILPFFIFISAMREEKALMFTIIRSIINKKVHIRKNGIMEAAVLCVYEDVSVNCILKYFDLNRYHMIIVINSRMEVQGILTESQIFDNLSMDEDDITLGGLVSKINKSSL